MKAEIIAIGNELVNGERIESNSNYLQKKLNYFSVKVNRVVVIPDKMDLIIEEIQKSVEKCQFLFITGGLGPTEDDLTRFALSRAFSCELFFNQKEYDRIFSKYILLNKKMLNNNKKQCFFPQNSKIFENCIGSASAFYLLIKKCNIFVFPGIPSELENIYVNKVYSFISKLLPKAKKLNKLVVKTIGIGESALDEIITNELLPVCSVNWESRITYQGIFLKFYPKVDFSFFPNELKKILENKLKKYIYGYQEQTLLDVVSEKLILHKLTVATVESCTGGILSKILTDYPGSSSYFFGALVTYSNNAKKLVQVDNSLIKEYGVVSLEVAKKMAKGVRELFNVDIAIAITGIAGPSGGTLKKPVGTVCFAIAFHQKIDLYKCFFSGNRNDIRQRSAYFALNLIRLKLL